MLHRFTKAFLLLTIICSAYFTQAQCTPDMSYTTPGAHPAILPSVCEGIAYDEVITIVLEQGFDAGPPFGVINGDSVTDIVATNLPTNLAADCGTTPCSVELSSSLAYQCIRVHGTTTEVGSKTISITYTAWASGFGVSPDPVTIDIEVHAAADAQCVGAGIFDNATEANFQVFPNPTANQTVEFSADVTGVQVFNATNQLMDVSVEGRKMNTSNLEAGLYLVKTDQGSVKLVVE